MTPVIFVNTLLESKDSSPGVDEMKINLRVYTEAGLIEDH